MKTTLTTVLLFAAGPAMAYDTAMPLRGDSLEAGVYLRSAGHTREDYGNASRAIDFHATTWVSMPVPTRQTLF